METDKYEFNKEKHIHTLNGKALTGVTTILGVIAKPALIQWSANMAVEFIEKHQVIGHYNIDTKVGSIEFDMAFTDLLKEARVAHRKKKEDAGAKGTDVHEIVELLITGQIEGNKGVFTEYMKHENPQVQHFIDWAVKNKVKFIATEEHLYSKKWWVGGICDFLCEIEDELWLGDIKTSSGIYPEHFFQTSAYQKMYQEMGLHQNFKGNVIVCLKKDGTFEEKRSISNEDNLLAFTSALNLYRVQEKIKSNII